MLLAVAGLAGSGKDTVADILAKGNTVKCALADPLKRIVRDVFDFSDDQLWGPSFKRNEPDKRYPRPHGHWVNNKCACCGIPNEEDILHVPCFLTPRYSLQLLGTEYGRHCFPNIWVNYALRVHEKLQIGDCYYDQREGLRWTSSVEGVMTPKKSVVISDTRFKNELTLIQAAGGKVIRIKRPGVEVPAWQHASETEQMEIPDDEFDYVLDNDGTLDDLEGKVRELLQCLGE